jgi:membrane protease YdiL (CAAX protease family)
MRTGRVSLRNLVVFSAVAVAAGWLGRLVDAGTASGAGQGPGMAVWILAPFTASLLLRALAGGGWGDVGIRPGVTKHGPWYGLSLALYPACVGIILLAGLGLGATRVSGFSSGVFFGVLLAILGFQVVKNFIEEFAFRGYLAPKAYRLRGGGLIAHLVVGAVWGVWHLPYLRAITPYSTESLATLAPRFILGAMAASIVYGEIRIRTGSMWPAWLMHTAGAVTVGGVFAAGTLRFREGMEIFFAPAHEGVLMMVLFAGAGVWLWRARTGTGA